MPPTIENEIRRATAVLRDASASAPRLDAELLMMEALGEDRLGLVRRGCEQMDEATLWRFEAMVERRQALEPVAYILGRKEFYGRVFKVDRSVLIPRPETELVVEVALQTLAGRRNTGRPPRVLDMGTGSGAIGITLAAESPDILVVCSDVSADSLRMARDNARAHGVADRVHLVRADAFAGLAEPFDLIVSNPPYVGTGEKDALMPDVRDFEPPLALYAGARGLDFIERLLEEAPDRLAPGGAMVLEIGHRQEGPIAERLNRDARWTETEWFKDLNGYMRVFRVLKMTMGNRPRRFPREAR